MTTLINEPRCKKLTFNTDTFLVELDDGRELRVPLSYFPRLLNATPAQRKKFVISGGGVGLHWDELDEDISVRGLLLGNADRHRAP
jgi:Protein of unknown function (DUF2442)